MNAGLLELSSQHEIVNFDSDFKIRQFQRIFKKAATCTHLSSKLRDHDALLVSD